MPGKICEVIDGIHKGYTATVSKDQEAAIVALKKVHVYLYHDNGEALLKDGRHVNGLISLDKLKTTGFYE